MIKLISCAAVAAAALFALPAAAADLHVANSAQAVVRISLANKSPEQLSQEIETAARVVCADASLNDSCVPDAIRDANQQVRDINGKRSQPASKIEVARNDPSTVRISLKGKSAAEVTKEIDVAATTVCKGAIGSDFRECVTAASYDAKQRLREVLKLGNVAMN